MLGRMDHSVGLLVGAGIMIAVLIAAIVVENTDVQVGLVGVLGTVVGGLMTYLGSAHASAREQVERRRTAGRLLQLDLALARMRVRNAQDNQRFWSERYDLPLEGWNQYRELVAQQLSRSTDWEAVAKAFTAIEAAQRNAVDRRAKTDLPRPAPSEKGSRYLTRAAERIPAAIETLKKLSGDIPLDEDIQEDERR